MRRKEEHRSTGDYQALVTVIPKPAVMNLCTTGKGWVLKFVTVMIGCSLLKLNIQALPNFFLDSQKLNKGHNFAMKQAEFQVAKLQITKLKLEQTNSPGPQIISPRATIRHRYFRMMM